MNTEERIIAGAEDDAMITNDVVQAVRWLVAEKCRLVVNAAEYIEDTRNKKVGALHKALKRALGTPLKLMSATLQTGDLVVATAAYREERLDAYMSALKDEGIRGDIEDAIDDNPGAPFRDIISKAIDMGYQRVYRGERSGKIDGRAIHPAYVIELKGSLNEIEKNIKDAKAAIEDRRRTGAPLPSAGLAEEIRRAMGNDVAITVLVMDDTENDGRRMALYNDFQAVARALGANLVKENVYCRFCKSSTIITGITTMIKVMARDTGRSYYNEDDCQLIRRTDEQKANDPAGIKALTTYINCGGNIDNMNEWVRLKEEFCHTLPARKMGTYFDYIEPKVSDDAVIF